MIEYYCTYIGAKQKKGDNVVSTQKMHDYLKIAVKIEAQLYALQISNIKIQNEIKKLQNAKYYDDTDCALNELTYNQGGVKAYINDNYTCFIKSLLKLNVLNSKAVSIIVILLMLSTVPKLLFFSFIFPIKLFGNTDALSIISGIIASIILLLLINLILEFIHKRIVSSMLKKEFNSNRFRHNRMREQSETLYAKNQNLVKAYNVQLSAVSDEIFQTKKLRNEFYSEKILPEKYRNLAAVSTMYEWLDTKRCTEIYGHGGLFDTYEYDLQIGTVINNLQEINAKMNIVIQNQKILIKEVRRGNEIASEILGHVKSIESTQERIASDVSDIKVSNAITAMKTSRIATLQEYQYYRSY